MSAVLESILQNLPIILDEYLENIFLNPDIWTKATKEGQEGFLRKIANLIEEYSEKLNSAHLIDILLQNIAVICNMDVTAKTDAILHISDIILSLGRKNLDESILSKIASYLNIFYIRKTNMYPLQIFYILRIVLNIFLSGIFLLI